MPQGYRRRYKKKSKIKGFLKFLLILGIAVFALKIIPGKIMEVKDKHEFKPVQKSTKKIYISPEGIHSSYAILVDLEDKNILMEKNADEKVYPASMTKIMTAIVAIENLPNTNVKVELSPSVFQNLSGSDASVAGFLQGEKVKAIDLLYGALLPSGAECCIGLADYIAGSEENFVDMMNKKAEKLGLDNTHFVNTTGLHDQNHFTTVKDIASLLSYALENETFREIFTSSSHSTSPTNKHPDGITFKSNMFKELGEQTIKEGKILGGKTGYTDEAGLCLASLAESDGKEYILVTAGAEGNHKTEQYNIIDAVTVYNSLENN